jgi:UDP-N-acetylglucosamine 2-epimerase
MILGTARPLLQNVDAYRSMAQARSPYGDGRASERIRYQLLKRLGVESPVEPLWT